MRYWLFQGNPARWDVFAHMRRPSDRRRVRWSAVRYLDVIAPGDGAALWLAGGPKVRGVYLVGTVTSAAYAREERGRKGSDDHGRAWPIHVVDLRFDHDLFDDPVLATDLKRDPRFGEAGILRTPRAGNPFSLTKPQWRAILDACK